MGPKVSKTKEEKIDMVNTMTPIQIPWHQHKHHGTNINTMTQISTK